MPRINQDRSVEAIMPKLQHVWLTRARPDDLLQATTGDAPSAVARVQQSSHQLFSICKDVTVVESKKSQRISHSVQVAEAIMPKPQQESLTRARPDHLRQAATGDVPSAVAVVQQPVSAWRQYVADLQDKVGPCSPAIACN